MHFCDAEHINDVVEHVVEYESEKEEKGLDQLISVNSQQTPVIVE